MVKLREVFPHGTGIVLVFEYMLSDLSEVIHNADRPLTEAQIKSYMLMLLKGVAFMHENNIMHRVCIIFTYIPVCVYFVCVHRKQTYENCDQNTVNLGYNGHLGIKQFCP